MSINPKLAKFDYNNIEEMNNFIALPEVANVQIIMRDQGLFVQFTDAKKVYGLTKEQHINHVKDAIAEAEADLADVLVSLHETKIGLEIFKEKADMKKVVEAYGRQLKQDEDSVQLKKAKVVALRGVLQAIESGAMLVGSDAVKNELEIPMPDLVPMPEDYKDNSSREVNSQAE